MQGITANSLKETVGLFNSLQRGVSYLSSVAVQLEIGLESAGNMKILKGSYRKKNVYLHTFLENFAFFVRSVAFMPCNLVTPKQCWMKLSRRAGRTQPCLLAFIQRVLSFILFFKKISAFSFHVMWLCDSKSIPLFPHCYVFIKRSSPIILSVCQPTWKNPPDNIHNRSGTKHFQSVDSAEAPAPTSITVKSRKQKGWVVSSLRAYTFVSRGTLADSCSWGTKNRQSFPFWNKSWGYETHTAVFLLQLKAGETAAVIARELAEQTKRNLQPGDITYTVKAMVQLVDLLDVQLRNLTPGGKDSAARSLNKVRNATAEETRNWSTFGPVQIGAHL